MRRIKTFLVDDEPGALNALESMIIAESPQLEIIGCSGNVDDAYVQIKRLQPELIFLDIQLRDQTGFDLLNMKFEHPFEVIFVTAYDQYAIQAFDKNALSYLLKPMSFESLSRVTERATKVLLSSDRSASSVVKARSVFKDRIAIPHGSSIEYLAEDELIYAKADGSYCEIYLVDGRCRTLSKPLKYITSCIESPDFFRPHRSYLVNTAFIRKWDKADGGNIILKDGTLIPLSKEGRKALAEYTLK